MHCHKTKQKITISCTNITPMQRMEHGSIQWICDLGNSSDVRVLALWHRRLAPAPSLQLYSCQKLHSRKWNWPKNLPSTYIDFSAFSRTKAIKLNEICLFCLIPIIPGHQTIHNTTTTLHDSNFWMFAFQHLISSVNLYFSNGLYFVKTMAFITTIVIIILMITLWHNRHTNLSIAPFSVLQRLWDQPPGQLTSFHYFNNNNETEPRDKRRIHVMGF